MVELVVVLLGLNNLYFFISSVYKCCVHTPSREKYFIVCIARVVLNKCKDIWIFRQYFKIAS